MNAFVIRMFGVLLALVLPLLSLAAFQGLGRRGQLP